MGGLNPPADNIPYPPAQTNGGATPTPAVVFWYEANHGHVTWLVIPAH